MQTDQTNIPNQDSANSSTSSATEQRDPSKASQDSEFDTKQKEITKLEQELAELKDKYVRVHADMENMRRRQERERADLLKFGLETIFKDVLPVLDSFEKALPDGVGTDQFADQKNVVAFADGMLMVKKQLLEVCRKHGLEPIDASNAPFDPNLHQAIQRLESDEVSVDTVANEYARGYQLHGRLLRPAMVSVLTPSGG